MIILGIETSCDETAISIVEIDGSKKEAQIKILSNVVLSQIPLHRKFGGVVPHLAKREHQKNLVPILKQVLREAGLFHAAKPHLTSLQAGTIHGIFERDAELLKIFLKEIPKFAAPKIDAIAVTVGPGLEPALWAGVNFARALSFIWKKPIIPVNHLEGHIYTAMLGEKILMKQRFNLLSLKLPILVLIVSGGHTELVIMKKLGRYKIIGETRDDAAGEAFDKVAKMMGLGYPGGPVISRLADKAGLALIYKGGVKPKNKITVKLPRPMINSNDFDFSFSGLKTAVLYFFNDAKSKYLLADLRKAISREFQNAVCDVLVSKTIRAARKYKVKSVILGGGVAANRLLRAELHEAVKKIESRPALYLPQISYTGDNALMIALAAYFSNKKTAWQKLRAVASLRLG